MVGADVSVLWRIPGSDDEQRLAEEWRAAAPFPHVVIDDFVIGEGVLALLEILEEEPVETRLAEIYAFDATAPEPKTEAMRALRDSFAATFGPPLSRITGKLLRRADMRAYAYRRGHYLLPHSDHQPGVGRALAYAWYLPSPDPPEGGELELFRVDVEDSEIVRTELAKVIEPRPNRIVIFDVSDVSLHQVVEVTAGLRVSLSGWFYA